MKTNEYAHAAPRELPMIAPMAPLGWKEPWYLRIPPHMPGCICPACKAKKEALVSA